MVDPKLRRVLAFIALISALSLVPAQAAGLASREPRGISLSERIERWELRTWNFLLGLFEKRGVEMDPNGARVTSTSPATVDGGR
jgi:hypothetical protein